MITHHPKPELLAEYASGAMPEPIALVVASHVEMCSRCARDVRRLESVGGALLGDMAPEPVSGSMLGRLLSEIDAPSEGDDRPVAVPDEETRRALPSPLWNYVGSSLAAMRWRRAGRRVRMAALAAGTGSGHATLLRAPAGTRIPEHTHGGSELTLVLRGSLRDGDKVYGPGDLAVFDAAQHHSPVAGPEGECLCVAALDAPIRLSNPMVDTVYRALPGAKL